jgi:hypothetical protein
MPEYKLTAKTSDSMWTQYAAVLMTKLNNCLSGSLKVTPKPDDLKKAKEWMNKPNSQADFILSFDRKKLGLRLDVKVGTNKDTLQDWNLDGESDPKKLRDMLEKLSRAFSSLVTKADLDDFDKNHP